VDAIESHDLGETPGPVTRSAQDAFWDAVCEESGAGRDEILASLPRSV